MRAFVTDGSRGIGRAVAETLRARGDEVMIGSRHGGPGVIRGGYSLG